MSRQLSHLAQELLKKQSNVTPRRPHKPRMTSSPLRSTVSENQPLFHANSADSTEEGLSPSETIISGSDETTMLGSEIETSLRSLREKSFSRRESARPVRAAALGVFYGSPNKECLIKSNPISVIFLTF